MIHLSRNITPLAIAAGVAAMSIGTAQGALVYDVNFDADIVGTNPADIISVEPAGTSIEVSDTFANSGPNSMFMRDNVNNANPTARDEFGSTFTTGSFGFSFREDPASSGLNFRVEFEKSGTTTDAFRIQFSSSSNEIQIRNTSNSFATSVALDTSGWNSGDWNDVITTWDANTDNIKVFVNGSTAIDFTDGSDQFNGFDIGQYRMVMGFVSATNRSGYVDDIQLYDEVIPEPTSLALLAVGGALLAPRRRRH